MTDMASAGKPPVERKFVDVRSGKQASGQPAPAQAPAAPSPTRPPEGSAPAVDLDAEHANRKAAAKPFRIVAVILWILGVACEIVGINFINGNIYFPRFSQQTWLIIWLVLDFVLVVIGSQMWKRANHINPPSEANKAEYWLQTEAGVIVAIIAFAPIIFVLLNDKKLDKKTRQICSIIACVALAAAGISGVDFHPATQEDYDAAVQSAAQLGSTGQSTTTAPATVTSNDITAYWTTFGRVYHLNPNCQAIKNSATIYSGSLADAFAAKRSRECEFCARAGGSDVLPTADKVAADLAAKSDSSVTNVSNDASVAAASSYASAATTTAATTTAATTKKAA
jgi:hypothetical protein